MWEASPSKGYWNHQQVPTFGYHSWQQHDLLIGCFQVTFRQRILQFKRELVNYLEVPYHQWNSAYLEGRLQIFCDIKRSLWVWSIEEGYHQVRRSLQYHRQIKNHRWGHWKLREFCQVIHASQTQWIPQTQILPVVSAPNEYKYDRN